MTSTYWAQFKNKKVLAYFFIPVLQTPSAIWVRVVSSPPAPFFLLNISHVIEAQPLEMGFKEELGSFIFVCAVAPL